MKCTHGTGWADPLIAKHPLLACNIGSKPTRYCFHCYRSPTTCCKLLCCLIRLAISLLISLLICLAFHCNRQLIVPSLCINYYLLFLSHLTLSCLFTTSIQHIISSLSSISFLCPISNLLLPPSPSLPSRCTPYSPLLSSSPKHSISSIRTINNN